MNQKQIFSKNEQTQNLSVMLHSQSGQLHQDTFERFVISLTKPKIAYSQSENSMNKRKVKEELKDEQRNSETKIV